MYSIDTSTSYKSALCVYTCDKIISCVIGQQMNKVGVNVMKRVSLGHSSIL